MQERAQLYELTGISQGESINLKGHPERGGKCRLVRAEHGALVLEGGEGGWRAVVPTSAVHSLSRAPGEGGWTLHLLQAGR